MEIHWKERYQSLLKKVIQAVQSTGSAPGHVTESTDQTQQPMEEILWAGANPKVICKVFDTAPHLIGELADNWEILAKSVTPSQHSRVY